MTPIGRVRASIDRMVRSPLNYWGLMIVDGLAAPLLIGAGVVAFQGPLVLAAAYVAAGWVGWTLLEYCLHRFIMHGPPSMARVGHAHHHANPTALVSAPFLLVFLVACGLWAIARVVLAPGLGGLLVGGAYFGYNVYTWVHHVEHHWEPVVSRVGYLRRSERLHHAHHLQHDVNFGVTTLVWDRVFGTFASDPKAAGRRHKRSAATAFRAR